MTRKYSNPSAFLTANFWVVLARTHSSLFSQAALAAEIRAATERVSESAAQLDIPADAERMR